MNLMGQAVKLIFTLSRMLVIQIFTDRSSLSEPHASTYGGAPRADPIWTLRCS